MNKQLIFSGSNAYSEFGKHLASTGRKKLLAVCGSSLTESAAGRFFTSLEELTGIAVVRFSGFTPNPDYNEIAAGVELFRSSGCDMICGAGGGSAMDTAKCIKLFAELRDTGFREARSAELLDHLRHLAGRDTIDHHLHHC